MVTSKKISHYSAVYAQTFLAAVEAPVRIVLESNSAAKHLRERYYVFRRHLEDADDDAINARVAILAPLARMSISDNVLTIYYYEKTKTSTKDQNHGQTNSADGASADADPAADDPQI